MARCILTPNCAEPYEAIQRAYDFAEWFAGEAIKPAWVWLCVFSEMNTSGKLEKYHRDESTERMSESEMREWHGCLYGVAHEALDEFVAEFWKERLKYFSSAAESSKAASPAASASPSKPATPQAGGHATRAEAQEQSQEAERTVDSAGRSGAKAEATFPKRAAWLNDRLLERGWSNSDPADYNGPDRKTVQKILRGEAVRNDVLQKLADALSQRHCKVNVLDIPQG